MPTLTQAQLRRKRTGATAPKKKSPRGRPVEGQLGLYGIKNGVRGKHYVWVQPGNAQAMAQYTASHYRPETWKFEVTNGKTTMRDGLPVVKGIEPCGAMPEESDEGKPIRIGDCILMSCSEQRKADIDEWGHDGLTGQVSADEIDEQLIRHKGGSDPLRGLKGFSRERHIDADTYGEHGDRHGEVTKGL